MKIQALQNVAVFPPKRVVVRPQHIPLSRWGFSVSKANTTEDGQHMTQVAWPDLKDKK